MEKNFNNDLMPSIGDYAPYLDDMEGFDEVVEAVNIGFTPHNLITV